MPIQYPVTNVGDLVLLQEGCLPTAEIGRWMGGRIDTFHCRLGVVVATEQYWGELWHQVLMPGGLGWVLDAWIDRRELPLPNDVQRHI